MSAIADVPAAIVAVNVKPQQLAGEESLMRTVPCHCTEDSLEWNCMFSSKQGGSDGTSKSGKPRLGGILPVIMQHVLVQPAMIKNASSEDVFQWGQDSKNRPIYVAVIVPRFDDFAGNMGDIDIELDATVAGKVFPVQESRRRFMSTVLLLLECIKDGLDRKYSSARSAVGDLLSLCDAGAGASSGSSAGGVD